MYVLHYAPDNASLIVRLALLEMELPFETRLVDRAADQHNSADYRKVAPTGLIPALETGAGEALFETGAILLHLAETSGKLFPQIGDADRPQALKWLFFIANSTHADCRPLFYAARFSGESPAPAAFQSAVRARLTAHLDLLERAAQQHPALFWKAGPSILTLYLVVICRWLQLYPKDGPRWFGWADWPALQALAQQCQDRPSAQAATSAEGLGTTIFTNAQHPHPPEGSAQ